MQIHSVILCGGSGTRLWPLSRTKYPKQFMDINNGQTLFKNTISRIVNLDNCDTIITVCNNEHRFYVSNSLQELELEGTIIIEEEARNTAPAIALAAFASLDSDPALLILPSDHAMENTDLFHQKIQEAVPLVEQGYIVTFGIKPNNPETGYGYIKCGDKITDALYQVSCFTEKPDFNTAKNMIQEGNYYWNSGIFFFKASTYLTQLKEHAPHVYDACEKAWEERKNDLAFIRPGRSFLKSPAISVDYAIMEKANKIAVAPLDVVWNDLGSWETFYHQYPKDEHGNVCHGDVIAKDSTNCYFHSTDRLITGIGLENITVIETRDAILVMPTNKSQEVKNIVDILKESGRDEYDHHPKVFRPWGYYESLVNDQRFQVKRIMIDPGEATSLQMHHHRAEHWVIVKGTAEITLDTECKLYFENESIYVPQGTQHRIKNPGNIPLIFIEVQSGAYLGEDDIIRIEDNYGRYWE